MNSWKCSVCGNTNYDEGAEKFCVACNWDSEKWCGEWAEDINSPEWKGFRWICPVCDNRNAGDTPDFDVCPLCGWEDDHLQRDSPDMDGGANSESLNEYRAAWERRKPK